MNIYQFNSIIELWECTFCLAGMLSISVNHRQMKEFSRDYIRLLFFSGILLAMDAVSGVMLGMPGAAARQFLFLANSGTFAFEAVLIFCFASFIGHYYYYFIRTGGSDERTEWRYRLSYCMQTLKDSQSGKRVRVFMAWVLICYALCILFFIVLAVNFRTGILFGFDSGNMYERGPLFFPLMMIFGFQYAGTLLLELYMYMVQKTGGYAIVAITLLPTVMGSIQILHYGPAFFYYSLGIVAFMAFVYNQSAIRKHLLNQERMLEESTSKLILSQIQPHFIFNALNTIYAICDTDPKTTKKAIADFSSYLRMNMDTLSHQDPIDFDQELKHIETYMWLEQLRFGEQLQVEYDIGFRDFFLPPLTIQPLMENAVKHGICHKQNGGTVRLSTKWEDGFVKIEIWDNGVGFDPNNCGNANGHISRGMRLVKHRLEYLCDGTMDIQSKIGEGTCIRVAIPWEMLEE